MASAAKKLAEHSQGMRRTKARTQVGQAFLPVRLFLPPLRGQTGMSVLHCATALAR